MDVSCPQCDTLYEFDARRMRGGVTLKCSQCGHLFRMDPHGLDESQRRWMVRQSATGDVLYFTGFDTLHRWIMEGSLGGEDEISRTGEKWIHLAEIGEFTPIFQVVDSIARLTGKRSQTPEEARSVTPPLRRKTQEVAAQRPGRVKQPTSPGLPGARSGPLPREEARRTQTSPGLGPRQSDPEEIPTTVQPAVRRETSGPSPVPGPSRRPAPTPAPVAPKPAPKPPQPPQSPRPHPSAGTSPVAPASSPPLDPELVPGEVSEPEPGTGLEIEEEDNWSLGELDLPEEPSTATVGRPKRSKWPWVVVGCLAVALGIGIWQQEALEEVLRGVTDPVDRPVADPTEVAGGDEVHGIDEVVALVDQARAQAVREAVGPLVEEALVEAQEVVGLAREAAEEQARREAQPSVSELLVAGRRALDRNDGAGARRRFERVLAEDPTHVEAEIGLGWALLASNEIDAAIDRFHSVLRRSPTSGEALIGIGRAERERGDNRAALWAYEEYLQRFPGGSQASIAEFQSRRLRERLGESDP